MLQAKAKAAYGKLMYGTALAQYRLPTLLVGTPTCMLLKARQPDIAVNQVGSCSEYERLYSVARIDADSYISTGIT